MSRLVLEACFPSLSHVTRNYFPFFWNFIFPPNEECHSNWITIPFSNPFGAELEIAWPSLIFACIFGIFVGLGGSFWLYRNFRQQHPYPMIRKNPFWTKAFFWFGIMNISALFLHCFAGIPPAYVVGKHGLFHQPSHGFFHVWDILYVIDIGSTSCSALCLFIAAALHLDFLSTENKLMNISVQQRDSSPSNNDNSQPSFPDKVIFFVVFILSIMGHYAAIPFSSEVLYIGVIFGASSVIFINLFGWPLYHGTLTLELKLCLCLLFFSAFIAVGGIFMDNFLCKLFDSSVGVLQPLFIGCDLGFLSLFLYIIVHPKPHSK